MGYEDVDYCLRVFDAGLTASTSPPRGALHHESAIRGRADQRSQRCGWPPSAITCAK